MCFIKKRMDSWMKKYLVGFFIFYIPVIAETNNLDKIFLDITMRCKTFRILNSPDKSKEVETNCIKTKLKENNLSKAKYSECDKEYFKKQAEFWNKFFKNLEEE